MLPCLITALYACVLLSSTLFRSAGFFDKNHPTWTNLDTPSTMTRLLKHMASSLP